MHAEDSSSQSLSQEDSSGQSTNSDERRINKREAALIIDSYPAESGFEPKSKVIYRRVMRLPHPYRTTRPKYAPKRTKAKSPRPVKQKRSKYPPSRYNNKYGPPKSHKKRPPKSKARGRKPYYAKPVYSVSKNRLQRQPSTPYRPPEPTGFGEPPIEYHGSHNPQSLHRPTFSDPPVDSYGAPLTSPHANEFYNQGYPMDDDEHGQAHNQVDEFQTWQNDQHNVEPHYAYTRQLPSYAAPDDIPRPAQTPLDYHDFNLNNAIYKHENKNPLRVQKHYNKPWTAKKPRDHVIVGGQYAEPPGRYVPKYPPIAHHDNDDVEHFGAMHEFDADTSASGTRSSYVNYKNSNMAFSPQNLNDAFSIVD